MFLILFCCWSVKLRIFERGAHLLNFGGFTAAFALELGLAVFAVVVLFLLNAFLPLWQVGRGKWRYYIFKSVSFLNKFVATIGQLSDFLLGSVLSAGEQKLFVVGVALEVLDLLLAVEHEPALNAEDLSVALGFNQV